MRITLNRNLRSKFRKIRIKLKPGDFAEQLCIAVLSTYLILRAAKVASSISFFAHKRLIH